MIFRFQLPDDDPGDVVALFSEHDVTLALYKTQSIRLRIRISYAGGLVRTGGVILGGDEYVFFVAIWKDGARHGQMAFSREGQARLKSLFPSE